VPGLLDALMKGRQADAPAKPMAGAGQAGSMFQVGAEWVGRVLAPTINGANSELEPADVVFQLDINVDPRSTNHAHADFWLTEIREGQRAVGPRYSINVLGGQNVWLYKTNAPGRDLGTIDQCGADEIQILLKEAAEEFGRMAR